MRAAASHGNASLTSAPHTPNRGCRTEARALRASQGQPQPSTLPLRGWSDRRTKGGSTGGLELYPERHSGPFLAAPCRDRLGVRAAVRHPSPCCAVRRDSLVRSTQSGTRSRHTQSGKRSRHQESDGSCRAGPSKSSSGKHVHLGVETRREWADEATDMGRSRAYEPASERHRPRPAFVNRTACRVPDSAPGRSPVPIRPPEGGRSAIDR